MTKTKTTKKALLASVLSLLICLSMLVGSTFAWFTDKATTGVNTIVSGNLDIDIVDANGNTLEGKSLGFVNEDGLAITETILWEPGCRYLLQPATLVNKGNLWVKYTVKIEGYTAPTDGSADIANVIDVYEGENYIGTLNQVLTGGVLVAESTLAPKGEDGSSATFGTLMLVMQETAGNEYMNKTIDGVSITVYATQYTKENDSFDDQYDEDAGFHYDVKMTAETAGKHLVGANGKVLSAYIIDNNIVDNFIVYAGATTTAAASQVKGNNTFNNCVFAANGSNSLWADTVEDGSVITFNNCTFEAGVKLGGNDVQYIFNNCSFAGKTDWTKGLILAYAPVELINCTFDYSDGALYSVYQSVGASRDDITVSGSTVAIVAGKATVSSAVEAVLKTAEGTNAMVLTQEDLDAATGTAYLGNGAFSLANTSADEIIGTGITTLTNIYTVNNKTVKDCVITYAPANAASGSRLSGNVSFEGCTFVGGTGKASLWADNVAAGTTATFTRCTFESMVKCGGGTDVSYTFTGCNFYGPYSWKYMVAYADVTIDSCTFADNLVVRGSGTPTLTLKNTTVAYENFASVVTE